jgi:hypothetical protein
MTVVSGPRRLRLARPATAWLLGGILLALAIAAVPLSRLAHQSLNAANGSGRSGSTPPTARWG